MAGGIKKSTKKFQKNHLKDTIDKRKEFAKVKQRQQVKAKKQARHAADFAKADGVDHEEDKAKRSANGADKDLSKMTVDEFFHGGFDLPEKKTSKNKSETSDKVVGKRKRNVDAKEHENPINGERDDNSGFERFSDGEDDLDTHKGDLEALAEKDPEFYKFLKENDAELLEFNADGDLAEVDDLSDEEMPKKKGKKPKQEQVDEDESLVSMAMVQKWRKAMLEQYSMRAMRQAVLAFRAAAYINSNDEKEHKYSISNPEVYHEVLVTTLECVPTVLSHHLPIKEASPGKVRVPKDSKKYRTLTPLFKSHTTSILHLLSTLSDASTIKLTLSSLTPLLPYILSFKKLLKSLTQTVVSIYSSSTFTDEATLVTAFLLLRRLAQISGPSIREAVLKSTYQGLIKGSRVTNTHTLPLINLMKNSCVELWSLDPTISYTTGFTYIRQLAVHLRTGITHPTKDSYKTIYNWQYVHSLDFWSRVLSTHCSVSTNTTLKSPQDSSLHPLIYPLVQITLGALRLIPTPTYFPLRFHLTRSLLRLSLTTDTYIPLAPSLLEVLRTPDLTKPPKPSTLPPLDFTTVLRAPGAYLRTRVYQDGVGAQVQELLAEFFACWARSIAFPELIIPPTVTLKRWLKNATAVPQRGVPSSSTTTSAKSAGKGNKNAKLNTSLSLLLQKLSANAHFIEERRRNVTFGPGDREQVDAFLRDVKGEDTPLGAFVEGLRRQREERERVLQRGRRDDERRKREEKVEREEELRGGVRGMLEAEEEDGGSGDDDDDEAEGMEVEMEDGEGEVEGESDDD